MQRETFSKPRVMTLGVYVELAYTASRVYRGITWYLTSFGDHGDREDWVADLPGVSATASRYTDQKGWGIAAARTETWEQQADQALASSLQYVTRKITETETKLADLQRSRAALMQAGVTGG